MLTIHRSKGLEFPIVYCPYAWDGRALHERACRCFHDPANDDRRTIDVGRDGPDFARHRQLELEEGRGEDLRLLYVALTRARHQAVLWWAGVMDSQHSPSGAAPLRPGRRRRGAADGAATRASDDRASRPPALAPAAPQVARRERRPRPPGARWHVRRRRPADARGRASSSARSTRAGDARRTASITRGGARGSRSGASPRALTSRRGRRRPPPRPRGARRADARGATRRAACRSAWATCPAARSSARRARRARGDRLRGARPRRPSSPTRWPRSDVARRRPRRPRGGRGRAAHAPSRRRSGRWWTSCGCAT